MIICVLSMFSGWKPSYYVPSYSTTSESGGYRTTSATNALNFAGKGNILGRNQGWLIVALTIVLLYLLAIPRATLSIGARWAILLISVFMLVWLFDTQIEFKKEQAAWTNRDFASGSMTDGEAPFWFFLGSSLTLIGSLFLTFRPWKEDSSSQVPPALPRK